MFAIIAAAVFGLIIGSFLNVVILRYDVRDLGGRSACMSCGCTLAWYELIPVLSWVALRGRCRTCRSRISIQYPLVEASCAILFALVTGALLPVFGAGVLAPLVLLAADLAIIALLVAIAAYDLKHTIIPDPWVYSFCAIALLIQLIFASQTGIALVLLSGPIAASPLFALWLVSRGKWMGFGDVKLALGMGWLLGPFSGIFAVLFGFMLGGLIAIPLLALSSGIFKRFLARVTPTYASRLEHWGFTMKSEVAFGPFLVASTLLLWMSMLYGLQIPFVP